MGKMIGIDFGTTYCRVAFGTGDRPFLIADNTGGLDIPNVIGFGRQGECLVGSLARRQAVTNAPNTVWSLKRLLGRTWADSQRQRQHMSYTCVPGEFDRVNLQIRDQVFTLEEVAALLCWHLKQAAEEYLREGVTAATIAIPACFGATQHQAIRDAATIAGFDVVHLISNSLAIALGWASEQLELNESAPCLVLDWGGGSLDLALVQVQPSAITVQATMGVPQLGGDDFDAAVVQWMLRSFLETDGLDVSTDNMACQRLREAAEKAKLELSTQVATLLNLPFITADETGPKHFEQELSRQTFEQLTQPLIDRAIAVMTQLLQKANLTPNQLSGLIMVGGSSRVPAFQDAIRHHFPTIDLAESLYPNHLVVRGAAIQAAIQSGELHRWQVQDILASSPSQGIGLSPAQLAHFRQQLAEYAEMDAIRRKKVEFKNEAEELLYMGEHWLRFLDRASPVPKSRVQLQKAIARLRAVLSAPNASIEERQTASQTLKDRLDKVQSLVSRRILSRIHAYYSEDDDRELFGEEDKDDDEPMALGVRPWFPRSPIDGTPHDEIADDTWTVP